MAKRGYKLQEFLAHSGNVNCLNIGKKACRHFVTGGDDHKVNVWAIGKPTALTSLSGHTSPVESTTFDSTEVLVLAGASSGVIKQWDLEEAKMVRTFSGHRSNCSALEFHPFGEFFASGSMDTHLRVWDIRKKGCIHTYKGHTQGIGTIKFTPDGRWVVSGGNDNVVKVWDLTAGKLLHDFKFHEGHIRSLDFHPLEFLLASGSSDRTVKFWDLETFELIGSTRPEATGVRSIAFHPDGRTLFSGQEESLKVYSWEPVISHDAVDMGWSTLGDICIHEEKLMGCSYYQNSVAVWVADISLIEPYGDASQTDHTDQKFNLNLHGSSEGIGKHSNLRCRSPDYDTKEIKNIYVDSSGGKPVITQKIESTPPKVPHHSDKEIGNQLTKKHSHVLGTPPRPNDPHALEKSFVAPSAISRDSPDGKDVNPAGESITFSRTKRGMLLRPAHVRRPSNTKNDLESLSDATESVNFGNTDSKCQIKTVSEDTKVELCNEKVNSVTERFEKVLSPPTLISQEASSKDIDATKNNNSVKVVNGVAVVRGRTRSLVERFEKREQSSTNEDQANVVIQPVVTEVDKKPPVQANIEIRPLVTELDETPPRQASVGILPVVTEVDKTPPRRADVIFRPPVTELDKTPPVQADVVFQPVVTRVDRTPPRRAGAVIRPVVNKVDKTPPRRADVLFRSAVSEADVFRPVVTRVDRTPPRRANTVIRPVVNEVDKTPPRRANAVIRPVLNEVDKTRPRRANAVIQPVVNEVDKTPPRRANAIVRSVVNEVDESPPRQSNVVIRPVITEVDRTSPMRIQREEPQDSERDLISVTTQDATEDLMQTHDIFISTLRMRLTKLQVVRHFWERKDIKGAIGAMRKLPDLSVQADVISVLMNKMDNLTLDMFSILLPILLGLLDSQMDRHAMLSLEMLLKLVAVFGPVIRSAVSARRGVGVDLHAEQRRECCNQCSTQLQKIQKILPSLVRRGGLVAKSALELNLVLQES